MSLNVGVVMDPIESITYKKDSTLAMLWAAQDRGWNLHYMEQSGLFSRDGQAMARMADLRVARDPEAWFERGAYNEKALAELDVILMRKDPPFDNEFLYTTYLLEQAERQGVLVVNRPQSLRDFNEKLFATQFPQCCPPLLVSREPMLLKEFYREQKDVIFKPLDGMGGASIFRCKEGDPNLSVILETLTQHGQRQIMAQRFIPEISEGDKRILMVDGEPVDYALARIPGAGETRGNLAAGGRGEGRPLTERDRWICAQVAPVLREKGLLFVGLDVIGDYLTEINVTSPTCIRELDDQFGLDIAGRLMDVIAERCAKR
ncbi:glutathione synthase [Motiliproteus sp. SC1-56]|uniref:glutathione synthase n=1 Tax=Motiliproteus sp. SC1-56 TaxID=2799565 RepID=UPI001A8E5606|nr:glutathione synthase [Motiliproteus sp. SC1-56]